MPRCHTSLPNPCLTEKRQTHLHTSGALTRRSSGTSRHVPLVRSHPPTKTTCRRSSSAARARCRSQAASASIVIPRKSSPSAASLLRSNAFASCHLSIFHVPLSAAFLHLDVNAWYVYMLVCLCGGAPSLLRRLPPASTPPFYVLYVAVLLLLLCSCLLRYPFYEEACYMCGCAALAVAFVAQTRPSRRRFSTPPPPEAPLRLSHSMPSITASAACQCSLLASSPPRLLASIYLSALSRGHVSTQGRRMRRHEPCLS